MGSTQCIPYPFAKSDNKPSKLAIGLITLLDNDRAKGLYAYAYVMSKPFQNEYKDRIELNEQGEPTLESVKRILFDINNLGKAFVDNDTTPANDVFEASNRIPKSIASMKCCKVYYNTDTGKYSTRISKVFSDEDMTKNKYSMFSYIRINDALSKSLGKHIYDKTFHRFLEDGMFSVDKFNAFVDGLIGNIQGISDLIYDSTSTEVISKFDKAGINIEDIATLISKYSSIDFESHATNLLYGKGVRTNINDYLNELKKINEGISSIDTINTIGMPEIRNSGDDSLNNSLVELEKQFGIEFKDYDTFGDNEAITRAEQLFGELLGDYVKEQYDKAKSKPQFGNRRQTEIGRNPGERAMDYALRTQNECIKAINFLVNNIQYDRDSKSNKYGKSLNSRDVLGLCDMIIERSESAINALNAELLNPDLNTDKEFVNRIKDHKESLLKIQNEYENKVKSIKTAALMEQFGIVAGFDKNLLQTFSIAQYVAEHPVGIGSQFHQALCSQTTSSNVIFSTLAKRLHYARDLANTKKLDVLSKFRPIVSKYISASGSDNFSFMYEKVKMDNGEERYFLRSDNDLQAYFDRKVEIIDEIDKRYHESDGKRLTKDQRNFISKQLDKLAFEDTRSECQFKQTDDVIKGLNGSGNIASNLFYAMQEVLTKDVYENLIPKKDPYEGLNTPQRIFYDESRTIQNNIYDLADSRGLNRLLPPQLTMSTYEAVYQRPPLSDRSALRRWADVLRKGWKFSNNTERLSERNNNRIITAYDRILENQDLLSLDYQKAMIAQLDIAANGSEMHEAVDFVLSLAENVVGQTIKGLSVSQGTKNGKKYYEIKTEDLYNGRFITSVIDAYADSCPDKNRKDTLKRIAKTWDVIAYRNTKEEGWKGKVNDAIQYVLGITSLIILKLNYHGLNNNAFSAFGQMIENAMSNDNYSNKSFIKGLSKASFIGMPAAVVESVTNKRDSFQDRLVEEFDPSGSERIVESVMRATVWGRLIKQDIMSMTYGAEESYFKKIVLNSILTGTEVRLNGKKTNLLSALKLKDGKIVVPEGLTTIDGEPIESMESQFMLDLKSSIAYTQQKLHGNYSYDRGTFVNSASGKIMLQMKGWMSQVMDGYFSPSYYNVMTKQREVGVNFSIPVLIKYGLKNTYTKKLINKAIANGDMTLAEELKKSLITKDTKLADVSLKSILEARKANKYYDSVGDAVNNIVSMESMRRFFASLCSFKTVISNGYEAMSPHQRAAIYKFFLNAGVTEAIALLLHYMCEDEEVNEAMNGSFFGKNTLRVFDRALQERRVMNVLFAFNIINAIGDSWQTIGQIPAVSTINKLYDAISGLPSFVYQTSDEMKFKRYSDETRQEIQSSLYENYDYVINEKMDEAIKYAPFIGPLYRLYDNIVKDTNPKDYKPQSITVKQKEGAES